MGARGRGQAFSMDLVIGVLIFLLAVGIIYSLFTNKSTDDPAPLRIESEVIAQRLATDPQIQIVKENQLQMATMGALANDAQQNYDALKQQLGVQDEFCIYIQDENGNLVYIQDSSGNKYPGIGASSKEVNLTTWNIPCGQPCTAGQCT